MSVAPRSAAHRESAWAAAHRSSVQGAFGGTASRASEVNEAVAGGLRHDRYRAYSHAPHSPSPKVLSLTPWTISLPHVSHVRPPSGAMNSSVARSITSFVRR